jgi:hypothetical protein
MLVSDQQHADSEEIKRLITQEAHLIRTEYQSMKLQQQHQFEEQTQLIIAATETTSQHFIALQSGVGSVEQRIIEDATQTSQQLATITSSLDQLVRVISCVWESAPNVLHERHVPISQIVSKS